MDQGGASAVAPAVKSTTITNPVSVTALLSIILFPFLPAGVEKGGFEIAILRVDAAIINPTHTQVNGKGLFRKIHPPQEVVEAGVGGEGCTKFWPVATQVGSPEHTKEVTLKIGSGRNREGT